MKDTYSRSRCIQYLIGVSHISWNVSLLSVIITLYNPHSAIICTPVETLVRAWSLAMCQCMAELVFYANETPATRVWTMCFFNRCLGVWSGFEHSIFWPLWLWRICSWEGGKTRYSRPVLWKYCNFRSIYFAFTCYIYLIFWGDGELSMFTNMFYENILDYVRIWKYCSYTSFTCAPKVIGLHFCGL